MKKHLKNKLMMALSAALALLVLLTVSVIVSIAADTPDCVESGCSGSYQNGFCSSDPTHLEPAVYNQTENRYEIGNAGQLYWFADRVTNDHASFGSANAVLTANVTVNQGTVSGVTEGLRSWTPIGSDRDHSYSGHFDGQGYTVSGLYHYSVKKAQYMGLFGYLQGAVVENLAMTNFYFQADHSYIGGIVGMMYESTVRNCYVQGSIFGRDTLSYVGGIVGASGRYDNLIESCLINADLRVSTDESEFTITLISGPYNYIGAIATTGGGEIKNSFYVTDTYSGDPTSPSNYTLTNVSDKTLSQLGDGSVAAALGSGWGQNYDNGGTREPMPVLGGAVVYFGYPSCDYAGEAYLSNTPLNPTKGHKQANEAQGHEIINRCAYCGGSEQGRLTLTAPSNAIFSEGTAHTASYTCTLPSCTTTHTISYCCAGGCIMPGTHTASVSVGDQTAALSFEIANDTTFPADATVEITTDQQYIYYKGETGARPTVKVTKGGTELVLGTDYSVYYTDNTYVTTEAHATVVLHIDGYNGAAKTVDFEIVPFQMTHVLFSNSNGKFAVSFGEPMWETIPMQLYPTYEGNVSFKFDYQYIMVEGVDFVTDMTPERYASLGNGSHAITITGIGNFSGTRTVYVEIERADFTTADRFEYEIDPGPYVYTGEILDPVVQIYDKVRGTYLTLGTDFYLSSHNMYPGEHDVSLTGSGNYFGSSGTVGTFTILACTAKPEAAVDSVTLEYTPSLNVSSAIMAKLSPSLSLTTGQTHDSFTYEYRTVGASEFTEGLPTGAGEYEVRILINPYGFPNGGNGYELLPSDVIPVTVKKQSLKVTVYDQYLEGDMVVNTYPSHGSTYDYEMAEQPDDVVVGVQLTANGHDITATVTVNKIVGASATDCTSNYDVTVTNGRAHTFTEGWTADTQTHSRTCSFEGCGFEQSLAHDKHTFTEDQEQLSISAICGTCGGDAGKLTLTVPQNAVYNGKPHSSALEGQIFGISDDQIFLQDSQPVNHGNYTTTLSVGNATITGHYSVERAPITITLQPATIEQFSALPTEYTFTVEGLAEGDSVVGVTVNVNQDASLTPGEYTTSIFSVQYAEGVISNNYDYTTVGSVLIVTEHTEHRDFDKQGFCSVCKTGYEQPPTDESGTYLISLPGHLYWLAQHVNTGNAEVNARLTCEIDLNPGYLFSLDDEGTLSVTLNGESITDLSGLRSWTPFGGFAGTFDGASFTIKGLYFNAVENNIALFASTTASATVKNLEIHNSYIKANTNAAAIVAANAGRVENCYSSGLIVANIGAGGIVSINTGTIERCVHAGKIISGDGAGGIVYSLESGSVTHSVNRGIVIGQNVVGGVVSSSLASTEISFCANLGDVKSTGQSSWSMGGIVGRSRSDVTNCYNTGKIEANGDNDAGGIVGHMLEGSISNCFNTGLVLSAKGSIGAIEGDEGSGTKKNNYYIIDTAPGGIAGEDREGEAEALTETQFESGIVAYLLNQGQESAVWGQEIGKDLIPVYDGMTVYAYLDCNGTTLLASNVENTPNKQHVDDNFDHVCDKENCAASGLGKHEDLDFDHACDYGCTESIGECRDADPIDHKCDWGCDAVLGEHADENKDHVCDHGCSEPIGACQDADPVDHNCDYGCGQYFGICTDTDQDHECDHGCGKFYGTHQDTNQNHTCEYGCSEPIGDCVDENRDHACDYGYFCPVRFGTCEDKDLDHKCDWGCTQTYGSHLDDDYDHVCDYGCTEPIGTCEDADPVDHKCDYGCSKTFGTHEDTDLDHACDHGCPELMGTCEDADPIDHKCDYGCSKTFGTHEDTDLDHACDHGCAEAIGTCEDKDPVDHKCDYGCSKTFGEHVDADGDTVCDHGCAETICTCPDLNFDHVCDNGCTAPVGTHEDTNLDHVCDYGCSEAIGEHTDADQNHTCDYGCSEAIGACEDKDPVDHKCDYGCSKTFGEHVDADGDTVCDHGCAEAILPCPDQNRDHACDDGCAAPVGTHEDLDRDHVCDWGCSDAIEAHEQEIGKHTCAWCGEVMSECADMDGDLFCDVCSEILCEHVPANNGDWIIGEDTHWKQCELCRTILESEEAHFDEDSDHYCDVCNYYFTSCSDEDSDHYCDSCGRQLSGCTDADNDHDCDVCGEQYSTCNDSDLDHVCDICGEQSECMDTNSDHLCDICSKELTTCTDDDSNHFCDVCPKKLSKCADEDADHLCDVCKLQLTACTDADSDHICDVCLESLGDHTDYDSDHSCDVCGEEMTECDDQNKDHACDICGGNFEVHQAGADGLTCDWCGQPMVHTCTDGDRDHNCDTCGEAMTECADNNADHACDVCGIALSKCSDENSDHLCDVCRTKLSACTDTNGDHACEICFTRLTECADDNNDHQCDVCGRYMTDHVWIDATCTTPARCELCGVADGEPIGHVAGEWQVISPATSWAEGLEQQFCTVCNLQLAERILPPLSESGTDEQTTEPVTESVTEPVTTEPATDKETEPVTKEPATEPATKPAEQDPSTQATEQPEQQKKDGCNSTLAFGAIPALLATCGIALALFGKKRKDS